MHEKNPDKGRVQQILHKINEAWTKGQADDMTEYLHDDLVILGPNLQRMGEGKKACIESYKEFMNQATVHDYREMDHMVDVWENTAVATYAFDISYEVNGQAFRERGNDMFVFNREREEWLAVWRMVLPLSAGDKVRGTIDR